MRTLEKLGTNDINSSTRKKSEVRTIDERENGHVAAAARSDLSLSGLCTALIHAIFFIPVQLQGCNRIPLFPTSEEGFECWARVKHDSRLTSSPQWSLSESQGPDWQPNRRNGQLSPCFDFGAKEVIFGDGETLAGHFGS